MKNLYTEFQEKFQFCSDSFEFFEKILPKGHLFIIHNLLQVNVGMNFAVSQSGSEMFRYDTE